MSKEVEKITTTIKEAEESLDRLSISSSSVPASSSSSSVPSSSSSRVNELKKKEYEAYEELKNLAMKASLNSALEEQNERGNTTVIKSEKELVEAVEKGDFKEVARITRSDMMGEIQANEDQIKKLKQEMKSFTKGAKTLQDIKLINEKLDGFKARFENDIKHWRNRKKQMKDAEKNTLDRLETIREKGIQVPDKQISDDKFSLQQIDFIVGGYDKIVKDDEEVIKYIDKFISTDLTKKQTMIRDEEDDSWMYDDEPVSSPKKGNKTKTKTKHKNKKGGMHTYTKRQRSKSIGGAKRKSRKKKGGMEEEKTEKRVRFDESRNTMEDDASRNIDASDLNRGESQSEVMRSYRKNVNPTGDPKVLQRMEIKWANDPNAPASPPKISLAEKVFIKTLNKPLKRSKSSSSLQKLISKHAPPPLPAHIKKPLLPLSSPSSSSSSSSSSSRGARMLQATRKKEVSEKVLDDAIKELEKQDGGKKKYKRKRLTRKK